MAQAGNNKNFIHGDGGICFDAMLDSDEEAVIVECIDDNWREEHKIGEGVVHEDTQGRESSMTQVHQPVIFNVIFTVAWKIPE